MSNVQPPLYMANATHAYATLPPKLTPQNLSTSAGIDSFIDVLKGIGLRPMKPQQIMLSVLRNGRLYPYITMYSDCTGLGTADMQSRRPDPSKPNRPQPGPHMRLIVETTRSAWSFVAVTPPLPERELDQFAYPRQLILPSGAFDPRGYTLALHVGANPAIIFHDPVLSHAVGHVSHADDGRETRRGSMLILSAPYVTFQDLVHCEWDDGEYEAMASYGSVLGTGSA